MRTEGNSNKTSEVRDRDTEVGVKLNNLLTALVLAVMGWVGYNIDKMRDDLASIRTVSSVNSVEVINLKARVDEQRRVMENHMLSPGHNGWQKYKEVP